MIKYMFWVRKRNACWDVSFTRPKLMFWRKKTDNDHLGGIYFYAYLPIIRLTNDL